MTCSCPTQLRVRIIACTPATLHRLHCAAPVGWVSLTDSRIDPVSTEQVDLILTGYGDRARVLDGLRMLVRNEVEVCVL